MDSTDFIVTDEQIANARQAGSASLKAPRAVSARYLRDRGLVEIVLVSGWAIQVPKSFSPRLAAADDSDCSTIEIEDSGLGIHWPKLDEDWYVPAVVEALAERAAA